jgi:hypothetical protein
MSYWMRFWTGLIIAFAGGFFMSDLINPPWSVLAGGLWGLAVAIVWTRPGKP